MPPREPLEKLSTCKVDSKPVGKLLPLGQWFHQKDGQNPSGGPGSSPGVSQGSGHAGPPQQLPSHPHRLLLSGGKDAPSKAAALFLTHFLSEASRTELLEGEPFLTNARRPAWALPPWPPPVIAGPVAA